MVSWRNVSTGHSKWLRVLAGKVYNHIVILPSLSFWTNIKFYSNLPKNITSSIWLKAKHNTWREYKQKRALIQFNDANLPKYRHLIFWQLVYLPMVIPWRPKPSPSLRSRKKTRHNTPDICWDPRTRLWRKSRFLRRAQRWCFRFHGGWLRVRHRPQRGETVSSHSCFVSTLVIISVSIEVSQGGKKRVHSSPTTTSTTTLCVHYECNIYDTATSQGLLWRFH